MPDDRCAICEEDFVPETKGDGQAEMITPDTMRDIESGLLGEDQEFPSHQVHYACGKAKGYTLA